MHASYQCAYAEDGGRHACMCCLLDAVLSSLSIDVDKFLGGDWRGRRRGLEDAGLVAKSLGCNTRLKLRNMLSTPARQYPQLHYSKTLKLSEPPLVVAALCSAARGNARPTPGTPGRRFQQQEATARREGLCLVVERQANPDLSR